MNYDVIDFEQDVLKRSYEIPVLVDFWAEWCGPCKVLSPVLEKLAEASDGKWALAKVNTEQHVELTRQSGIRSIPTVNLFVDGKVTDMFVGALSEVQIQSWLRLAIPSKYRKIVEQAERLIQDGNLEESQTLIERVLQEEPDNARAKVLLARSILFNKPEKAVQLVEDAHDPQSMELIEAIKTAAKVRETLDTAYALPQKEVRSLYVDALDCFLKQEFDQALLKFIEVIRTDRYYEDDGARKACIAIFKILGDDHEITLRHRRDFSSALY
ncbi:MAG: thioredoxin [bacterium]